MSATTDLRTQLRSLKIDGAQRPVERARSRRGLIIAAAVVALLAGGGYLAFANRDRLSSVVASATPQKSDVRFMTVVARSADDAPRTVLTATGKIVSDHRVLVFTKVSGQIVELFFEQGDRVKAGQKLAKIEDVLFKARRDEARATVERTKARLVFEQANFERINRLYASRLAPEIEFINARRNLDEARAQLEADNAALAFTEKVLFDTEVTAPIGGVILERNVNVGDFVTAEGGRGAMANAQLGSIADMNLLRVEVDISELDIARLRKDMTCQVIPDAYKDRKFGGHIMWIDPGANYSKATVQVKVRIEDPDDHLRVEGTAQVAFLADKPAANEHGEQAATIWIPKSACLPDASGKSARVFVATDGRIRQTPIQIGAHSGDLLQVLDGLRDGETIAVDHLDELRDGQRVKVASAG